MSGILNIIRIGIDPDMFEIWNLVLTWHGFFTFVGVAVAVLLVAYWSRKEGISPDTVYSVAVWAILGGVVGARIVHVIDFWGRAYQDNPITVFYVWQGGIAIYGAVLGGFIGGALYMVIRNRDGFINFWNRWLPWMGRLNKIDMPSVGRLADITAPFILMSMAIGRIGDIINGEHFARVTSLPWGFVYDHPQTVNLYINSFTEASGGKDLPFPAVDAVPAAHPAVVYEIIYDVIVASILWFFFRNRLRPHGMLFVLFLGMYSLGRFFISFIREDKIWIVGLDEAQIIALITLVITVTFLITKAQIVRPIQRLRTAAAETPSEEP